MKKSRSREKLPFTRGKSSSTFSKDGEERKPDEERVKEKELKVGFSTEAKDKGFDKKKEVICWNCNKKGHIRPICPELIKNTTENINNIGTGSNLHRGFEPFLCKMKINGVEQDVLRVGWLVGWLKFYGTRSRKGHAAPNKR